MIFGKITSAAITSPANTGRPRILRFALGFLAEADRRESAMKSVVPLILVAGICTANASAQSSLFDKYDVKMTGWAQLPAGRQWGGETSWVAADGKGQVVVFVRKAPYFQVFTTEGKFVRS